MADAVGAVVRDSVPEAKLLVPVQFMLAAGMLSGLTVPVGRTGSTVAVAVAAFADVAAVTTANGIRPAVKAAAATPASVRLLVRIALDNASSFRLGVFFASSPGAEGSIPVIPGRTSSEHADPDRGHP
jgi:hypothetical protein